MVKFCWKHTYPSLTNDASFLTPVSRKQNDVIDFSLGNSSTKQSIICSLLVRAIENQLSDHGRKHIFFFPDFLSMTSGRKWKENNMSVLQVNTLNILVLWPYSGSTYYLFLWLQNFSPALQSWVCTLDYSLPKR